MHFFRDPIENYCKTFWLDTFQLVFWSRTSTLCLYFVFVFQWHNYKCHLITPQSQSKTLALVFGHNKIIRSCMWLWHWNTHFSKLAALHFKSRSNVEVFLFFFNRCLSSMVQCHSIILLTSSSTSSPKTKTCSKCSRERNLLTKTLFAWD